MAGNFGGFLENLSKSRSSFGFPPYPSNRRRYVICIFLLVWFSPNPSKRRR
jgi:hypothetical protein